MTASPPRCWLVGSARELFQSRSAALETLSASSAPLGEFVDYSFFRLTGVDSFCGAVL
jgi:hypothetical protein